MIGKSDLEALADGAGLVPAAISIRTLAAEESHAIIDLGEPLYPASMIKTPLAVAVTRDVEAGRLEYAARIAVTAANMTVNDAPSPLTPGAVASLGDLIELMLARSDNVATNMLIDCIGRERASEALADLGFPLTAIRRKLSGALPLVDDPMATGRNTHPASDASRLFARIAQRSVPGAAFIERCLAGQYWNAKLSLGLDPGDWFAHKTGDTDEVSHDGGILRLATGERYALAVYTGLPSNDDTDRRFGAFMRALRPFLSTAGP